jgi:serine/threonine protein kinase/molybdenum-dependent DNA-binding transcriptional regulator ModE
MEELDLGQTIRGFVAGQKVFQRYVLKSILGRGGMGIVWRAFDEHLERDVALKFLPELIIHDKAVLDDLKRETKRNLDLTHHHIVRIYDFAQDSTSACISMEFVDGETLSALRIERPDKVFQADELLQPMSELCEALTYAHIRARIVHRDLKPANLMLTSGGVLKVTDFGIARSLSDSISLLTMGRGVSGTLLYMSPQQLDGDRPSAADDIYSVGATIYELLTSKPPFYSGGVERQIHEKVPPPMSARREDLGIAASVSIPKHWEECVAACLAKDPGQRPPSAAVLIDRLRGISSPPPIPVAPTPPPPIAVAPSAPPPKPAASFPPIPSPIVEVQVKPRSNRVFYIGAAAAALVLFGGAAIYLSLRPRNESVALGPLEVTLPSSPVPTPAPRASSSPPPIVARTVVPSPSIAATATATTATAQSASYSSSDGYDPGIALVDMNRIFKEYNKTKDYETKINQAKDAAKKEYDDRADNYKKALDEINKLNQQIDSPGLSADKKASMAKDRDEKIADIKNMEREINDFRQTREKQLQDQATKMRAEIVKEITQEIAGLNATSRGFVYDRNGQSTNFVPVLVQTPGRADVSDKVIAALNGRSRSSFTGVHDLSVGVVDMNRIFKSYNKTKVSEVKINEAKDVAKKEYDDRAATYKKALDGINNLNTRLDSPSLSASARTALTKERDEAIVKIKAMEKEINEFRQTREQQLQEQAMRMREGIVKDITDAIAKGFQQTPGALLIDISGQSTNYIPVVSHMTGVPDFSDDVITALNSGKGPVKFHTSPAAAKALRFGVVNMNRAFKAWPETVSSEAKINEAKEAAKKEYDARADQYKKALEEINSLNKQLDSPSLAAEPKTAIARERDAKITKIKDLEREINEFRTKREKELQDQATKMREEIVAKITATLKVRAEAENFNLIFDSSGESMNYIPVAVLSSGMPDLTDKVLKK